MGLRSRLPSKAIGLWPSSKRKDKDGSEADMKKGSSRPHPNGGANQAPARSAAERQLDKMFEALRSEDKDAKDMIGAESSMSYLMQVLKISLENASLFAALELVRAPSIGEITKQGYIEGWKQTGVNASFTAHASYMKHLVANLSRDREYFKRVYRYAFVAGKEPDQRALSRENAIVFWNMLFTSPGIPWSTKSHDWLELWKEFVEAKWTRSVNRDMWNMTLEFALKTLSDETLSFWSEDGAWPSVIDAFVLWCKTEKGIGGGQPGAGGAMDTAE